MLAPGRKFLLFFVLAGVLALAWFAPAPDDPALQTRSLGAARTVAPLAPRASSVEPASAAPPPAALPHALPVRRLLSDTKSDLFGAQSWQPPPPKAAPAAPAPPPQAPPLAFRFAGRWVQDGVARLFVTKGDTPLAVKVGDTLDGYLVESIAGQAINLVYTPLGTKASISISGVGDGPAQGISSSPATSPLQTVTAVGAPVAPATSPSTQVSAAAGGKGARVQWDGPLHVKAGANFSLSLRVDGDQPISASPMQLRFDPAVLESVSVRPGKLYVADAARGFNYRVNTDGSIFVGAASQSASGAGGAELLVLTFKALKTGAFAEVSLTALNLQGLAGRAVAHEALTSFRAPVTP